MGPLTALLALSATVLATHAVADGSRRVVRRRLRPSGPQVAAPSTAMNSHLGRVARRRAERAVPDTLELFGIVLRAGLTTRQAIDYLASSAPTATRPAFAEAAARVERGVPPADALEALPDVLGRDARSAVDLIGPADRYGLPLAPALEQLSAEARRSRRRRDEADARRLPVRLSFPLVVCTLPSFVLLAIAPAVLAALSSLGATAW